MQSIGIYVHTPFCVKKCGYCSFNSIVPDSFGQIKSYVRSLLRDIQLSSLINQSCFVNSVYFGGGTPSFIEAEYIRDIMEEVRKYFQVKLNAEIVIEMNPASVSRQKLLTYKKAGINRVSLGVQSFQDKYLKLLGRPHNCLQAFKSLAMLKKQGFDNISIDLIYGLPGQSLPEWEDDLKKAIECEINHISLYDLVIEKGTPFYEIKNNLKLADNDLQALMYKKAHSFLTNNKFKHYEISSFSKQGKQSMHNLIYWNNLEYVGIGSGAYSYINRERFSKSNNIQIYKQQAKKGEINHYGAEKLCSKKLIEETLILRLRLLDGFQLVDIEKSVNQTIPQDIISVLNKFVKQGLILFSNNSYKLSQKGLLHYDTIASEFLS